MYLSIDFEDYYHDLKRGLGLWRTGPLKIEALWDKYQQINNFLKYYGEGEGKYATFFCTGILAKKEPDLINQISKDGHEIACHYFYHDVIANEDNKIFPKMLLKAKESLEEASNKRVKGFRAPYFLINKQNNQQYKQLENFFDYDSSFHCSNLDDLDNFKRKMKLEKLKIIPLYSSKFLGKNLKLGGSYLKIFPTIYSRIIMDLSQKAGLEPHVYLHPYEFDIATDFKIQYKELAPLGIRKAIYWSIRQNQWLSFKNISTKRKLKFLTQKSKLKGKLENILREISC